MMMDGGDGDESRDQELHILGADVAGAEPCPLSVCPHHLSIHLCTYGDSSLSSSFS